MAILKTHRKVPLFFPVFLAIFLFAFPALGDDLTVDGGATYFLSDFAAIRYTNEFVGYTGVGSLVQSGGTNETYDLYVGYNSGSRGMYNLKGGVLAAGRNEYIGVADFGIFFQSGGSNTASNLVLGFAPSGFGSYELSDGTLEISQGQFIGYSGKGEFNQRGGSNAADILALGVNPLSSGSYVLWDGTLSTGVEYIGYSGDGRLAQTGGVNSASMLDLGVKSSGIGSYSLDGGTLLADIEIVGDQGIGSFMQTGGLNTAQGLAIGATGGNGSYMLVGGDLQAMSEVVGLQGAGRFQQSGGTNTAAILIVGTDQGIGSYTLSGGILSTLLTSIYTGSGTFTQTGGTFESYLGFLNYGTFNYGGGVFNSGLKNYGTVNFNADFTSDVGLINSSSTPLVVREGRTITLNGLGLINQSVFVLDGNLAVGSTAVNDTTGIFSGSGTVTGELRNAGTLRPGDSVGTLNVSGTFTQTSGGTIEAEIASQSSHDSLSVTGTAVLDGTFKPVLVGGFIPNANQVFSGLITATDRISGSFASIDGRQLTPTLSWQPRYSANSFDLVVERDYSASALGLSANLQAVGDMLNGNAGITSGDFNAVLDRIDRLATNSAVGDAFQQISPEKSAAFSTIAFAGSSMQAHVLSNRINGLRFSDLGMPSGPGFNFNYTRGEGLSLESGALPRSLDADGKAGFGFSTVRPGLYFEPGIVYGWQRSTPNRTGFDFTGAGFTTGADFMLANNFLAGFSSGYSHTGSDFSGSGGSIEADTIPLNAYAAYIPGPFYAVGSLGYALNLFDIERDFNFGGLARSARGSTTGHQLNAYGEAGYDLKMCDLILTPNATLSYSRLWVDGFSETGAAALDLTYANQTAESLQTGIGARLTVPFEVCGIKYVPQLFASYQHEFSNDSRGLDARLAQAANSFTFRTDDLGGDFAVIGSSLAVAGITKNLLLQVNYSAEVGRDDYAVHYFNAALRYEF